MTASCNYVCSCRVIIVKFPDDDDNNYVTAAESGNWKAIDLCLRINN